MNSAEVVSYRIDFAVRRKSENGEGRDPGSQVSENAPRIARLLALALRMERLIRERKIQDYATAARLGRVTRARLTQITKLLHLAPDIQEEILFLPQTCGLNERNLRAIVGPVGWEEQRSLFRQLLRR